MKPGAAVPNPFGGEDKVTLLGVERQRSLIDDRVGVIAVELGIIGREMFDGGTHTLALYAFDICDG